MPPNMLGPDLNVKAVNESQYRGMIGPLMNLTANRPNIQFSTALCKTSRKHKESHLISVKNFQVPKCENKQQSVTMFSTEAEDIAAAGSKALENSKVYFSTPTGGIYVKIGVHTFRNSIGAHYLPHSSEYVAPPSIDIVRPWFETIGYGEAVPAKGTLKKSLLPPRWSKEAKRAGPLKHPLVPKLSILRKEKRVTSKERANPQLSSGMSAFNLNKPIYPTSFIIHSESASENDASVVSTAEADLGNYAPSDFVPQQQANEGTKSTSYDYLFACTNPHVLADQTKSVSKGLETVLAQPITGKGVSSVARQIEEETSSSIKLEDLEKLVSHVQPSFKDLDSPKDDPVIVVDDTDEDEEDEIHAATNHETKDTLVPKSSSQSS
ncbi:hypothetical protein Tco_0088586 [Tanacetum coccineum]